MPTPPSPTAIAGRGPNINPANRFDRIDVVPEGEWLDAEFAETGSVPHPHTQFFHDATESILVHNDSPDVGPGWSLNCYRGCEHGCAYCFARPYHDYLGWSSGIEFETKILVKQRAPALLRAELAAKKWKPEPILMSGVTDCYQPAERHFRLTRQCLEVLAEFRQPVGILTKNFLVTRDLDLLAELARWQCASVNVTIVTLDAAAQAGATRAGYVTLRLPYAVKDVFLKWLDDHEPGKKERVLSRIRDLRGGKLYDSTFGDRLRGQGIFAEQIRQMFEVATRRAGLNRADRPRMSTAHFRRPGGVQMELL